MSRFLWFSVYNKIIE